MVPFTNLYKKYKSECNILLYDLIETYQYTDRATIIEIQESNKNVSLGWRNNSFGIYLGGKSIHTQIKKDSHIYKEYENIGCNMEHYSVSHPIW